MKKINIPLAISAIFSLILLSLLFSTCENNKTQLATINSLQSENKEYRLKNGQLVLSQEVVTFDNAQMKKKLKELAPAKKFVKVKTVTKFVTETKIDTLSIVYRDSVPCQFERFGQILSKNYSLNYKSNQSGVTISKLEIPDSLVLITGTKRKWLFGKQTTTIDVIHSNPIIKSSNLQSFELKEKKRFYQTDLFKIGIGLIGGILIAH